MLQLHIIINENVRIQCLSVKMKNGHQSSKLAWKQTNGHLIAYSNMKRSSLCQGPIWINWWGAGDSYIHRNTHHSQKYL